MRGAEVWQLCISDLTFEKQGMKTTHVYLETKGKNSDLGLAATKTQGGSTEKGKTLLTDPIEFSMLWVISLHFLFSTYSRGQ